MLKSNLILNFYPIILNLLMIMIMALPNKYNKYNPITMVLLLITLTTLISIKINLMSTTWSSFIIFLIMIGGLMIIFMYITSMSSNELFMINFKFIILSMIKLLPLIIFLYFYLNSINFNLDYNWFNFLLENFNVNFYELYSNFYLKITYFCMNYLFYSMVCIMNICYKTKSPMRQLNFN